jgi:hypothetical protein
MSAATLVARAVVGVVAALLLSVATVWAAGNVTVKMKSQRHSGVSATATLAEKDGATVVAVRVNGKSGVTYFPDIRRGTCALAAQSPEIPLALVTTSQPAETVLDVPLNQLTAGSYVVMLHPSDGTLASLAPDAAVACGQIRAKSESSSVANAAPITGIRAAIPASDETGLSLVLLASAGGVALAAHRLSARGRAG